jgi:hypothetical protein
MTARTYAGIALVTTFLIFSVVPAAAYQQSFTSDIIVSEEYNDNLFLDPTDEIDDFITRAAVFLGYEIRDRSKGLRLDYTPEYNWYKDNSDFNYLGHRANLSAWANLTKTLLAELNNRFVRTADPVRPDDQTVRNSREPYIINNANLRLTQRFGPEDLFYLEYVNSLRDESDPDREDNMLNSVRGEVTYWFIPRFGMDLFGSYGKTEYRLSDDIGVTPSDDFDEWLGRLRFNYKFSRVFTGFLQYRYANLNYDGLTEDYQIHEPTVGITYDGFRNYSIFLRVGWYVQDRDLTGSDSDPVIDSVITRTFEKGTLSLALRGGADVSARGSQNLGFTRFYAGDLRGSYRFLRQLSGDAYISYGYYDYPDQIDITQEGVDNRLDKIASAGVGVTYTPLQWLAIRLTYDFRDSNSNSFQNDYRVNRVLLSFTFELPRWRKQG